jgi:hypothetical protein
VAFEEKHMRLLPPAPHLCQQCAVEHSAAEPHNRDSLYYQFWFAAHNHGRNPTWTNAMAHCHPQTRALWREKLVEKMNKHNLPIPSDLVGPEQPPEEP